MDTQTLTTPRLVLEPLRVEHAEEMAPLLDDPGLHDYTGGEPPTLGQLRRRYQFQVVGRSRDGAQHWLNWILRRQDSGRVVGFVQATVTREGETRVAEIAWVVGTAQQGRGYAKEATRAMVSWLRKQGVGVVIAHVHPQHRASEALARAAGLEPTDSVVDGETRWQG
ncbi:MAG TPA: GNAT family N-acetyltransferase [Jatrophihabitans sp.]|jgi:RimJ/RimL family protein N-acetyltransferase|nr:GNAT family N-acetyltransferase [Jatrophihabitans sp.]